MATIRVVRRGLTNPRWGSFQPLCDEMLQLTNIPDRLKPDTDVSNATRVHRNKIVQFLSDRDDGTRSDDGVDYSPPCWCDTNHYPESCPSSEETSVGETPQNGEVHETVASRAPPISPLFTSAPATTPEAAQCDDEPNVDLRESEDDVTATDSSPMYDAVMHALGFDIPNDAPCVPTTTDVLEHPAQTEAAADPLSVSVDESKLRPAEAELPPAPAPATKFGFLTPLTEWYYNILVQFAEWADPDLVQERLLIAMEVENYFKTVDTRGSLLTKWFNRMASDTSKTPAQGKTSVEVEMEIGSYSKSSTICKSCLNNVCVRSDGNYCAVNASVYPDRTRALMWEMLPEGEHTGKTLGDLMRVVAESGEDDKSSYYRLFNVLRDVSQCATKDYRKLLRKSTDRVLFGEARLIEEIPIQSCGLRCITTHRLPAIFDEAGLVKPEMLTGSVQGNYDQKGKTAYSKTGVTYRATKVHVNPDALIAELLSRAKEIHPVPPSSGLGQVEDDNAMAASRSCAARTCRALMQELRVAVPHLTFDMSEASSVGCDVAVRRVDDDVALCERVAFLYGVTTRAEAIAKVTKKALRPRGIAARTRREPPHRRMYNLIRGKLDQRVVVGGVKRG